MSGSCKQHRLASICYIIFAFSVPFTPCDAPLPVCQPRTESRTSSALQRNRLRSECANPRRGPGLYRIHCRPLPVCLERRSYIVSTEVFMGLPSWEVTSARLIQSRHRSPRFCQEVSGPARRNGLEHCGAAHRAHGPSRNMRDTARDWGNVSRDWVFSHSAKTWILNRSMSDLPFQ